MEDNNNLPSIPSNYVTLAQLQERWLKQKEKEKQLHEKQQEEQQQKQQQQIPKLPQHNPPEYHRGRRPETLQLAWRAIPACPTGSRHAAVECPPAESGPKNPIAPGSNRVAVEVSRETNESVEAKADIGDGNNGKDGKKKQSKKKVKSGKGKPRAGEEKKIMAEDAMASTMMGKKEAANSCIQGVDDKRETKIELNGSNSNDLGIVEAKADIGDGNNGKDGKKKQSKKKVKSGKGKPRAGEEKKIMAEDAMASTMMGKKEAANSCIQGVDDKRETKIELNGSKSNDLGIVEAKADIGDGNNGKDGKKKQSKKKVKSGKGKPRAGEEKKIMAEDAMASTMMGKKEAANSCIQGVDDKRETKIELNGSNSNDLGIEVEQKLGTIPMNFESEKQNSRVNTCARSRGSQRDNVGRNYRIGPYGWAYKEKKKMAEDATQSTMVWNKEAANSGVQRIDGKKEAKVELNDSKSNDLMMEVEQKLGTVSMNSENEKQNSRLKTYDSSRGSQRNNEGRNNRIGTYGRAAKEKKKLAEDAMQSTMEGNKEVANSDVQRVDDKRETKIELNGSKSNDLGIEVEQKLGTISMNSENEKQTSRVKTQDSSRCSQRNDGGRNYRIGPYGDRYSNFGPYGGRIRAQKNWVRKSEDSNGNVYHNEISSK